MTTKISREKFSIEKTIERRASRVLKDLLARGGWNDWSQARKYAAAAGSHVRMRPELVTHPRRRGGAVSRLWSRIVELCDEHFRATGTDK